MATEAQEYKTLEELEHIATKMLIVILENYALTRSQMSMVIFLMNEENQYLNIKELIEEVVEHGKQD